MVQFFWGVKNVWGNIFEVSLLKCRLDVVAGLTRTCAIVVLEESLWKSPDLCGQTKQYLLAPHRRSQAGEIPNEESLCGLQQGPAGLSLSKDKSERLFLPISSFSCTSPLRRPCHLALLQPVLVPCLRPTWVARFSVHLPCVLLPSRHQVLFAFLRCLRLSGYLCLAHIV